MSKVMRALLSISLLVIFVTIIVGSTGAQVKRSLRIGTQAWIVKKYKIQ